MHAPPLAIHPAPHSPPRAASRLAVSAAYLWQCAETAAIRPPSPTPQVDDSTPTGTHSGLSQPASSSPYGRSHQPAGDREPQTSYMNKPHIRDEDNVLDSYEPQCHDKPCPRLSA